MKIDSFRRINNLFYAIKRKLREKNMNFFRLGQNVVLELNKTKNCKRSQNK